MKTRLLLMLLVFVLMMPQLRGQGDPRTIVHDTIYLSNTDNFRNQHYVIQNYLRQMKHDTLVFQPQPQPNSIFTLDVVMTCYGDENTRNFLRSPNDQVSCLSKIFMAICDSAVKIQGLNLYFPHFAFKEKRAMAQFVKSVSLVIDSSHIEKIHQLRLYVSFDKETASNDSDYCCCLAQMADSVLLVSNPSQNNDLMSTSFIDSNKAVKLSMYAKMLNQLYLARYFIKKFPVTDSTELKKKDLMAIMNSDYENNTWERFMCGLIIVACSIFIFVILYCTLVPFAYYINKNLDFLFIVILMLLLEIFLLFFSMIEAMSKENVFVFNGDGHNKLLLLPLILILIIPLMKMLGGSGSKP